MEGSRIFKLNWENPPAMKPAAVKTTNYMSTMADLYKLPDCNVHSVQRFIIKVNMPVSVFIICSRHDQ